MQTVVTPWTTVNTVAAPYSLSFSIRGARSRPSRTRKSSRALTQLYLVLAVAAAP
jgi:hypothetical protein